MDNPRIYAGKKKRSSQSHKIKTKKNDSSKKYYQKISEQGQKFVLKDNISFSSHILNLHVINVNVHI